MATAGIVNCSPYGMACTECNELVIAPALSEYVGSREIRHFWSCENCGHKIEMKVDLRISAETKLAKRTGLRPTALVA
jgi:DNA-directed RNA polymerase subunit RPC12/RpoP